MIPRPPARQTTPNRAGRRALVRAAVAAGGGVLVAAPEVPAAAAATAETPERFVGEPLLTGRSHLLVNRFSYGLTPALTRAVRAAGGSRAWFETQLRPERTADAGTDALVSWWPSLRRPHRELWQRQVDEVESGWEVMVDYQRWLLMRRISTNRPVHELMVELWMNHFNVPVHADGVFTWRFHYDQAVRRHALGKFSQLLRQVVLHPAMGMYLGNAQSTKRAPNENLGRELLELHTVGRGAGYTEDDVKASARILTGNRVDMWTTFDASYDPGRHWTGPVRVMGFSHRNGAADGRAVTLAYLDHLAHHPATARRVARLIATRFVSDDPSAELVEHLARTYLAHDTAIAPVLRALVATPEFAASAGAKLRDPGADVVATYRALGVKVARPRDREPGTAAHATVFQAGTLGLTPHDWPRPDGPPQVAEAWSHPARLMHSFDLHFCMSGGWWPTLGITYRTPTQWMPQPSMRFDLLADHLSQQLLGRHVTPTLLQAACEATGCRVDEVVGPGHPILGWEHARLLSVFLDTPEFLTT